MLGLRAIICTLTSFCCVVLLGVAVDCVGWACMPAGGSRGRHGEGRAPARPMRAVRTRGSASLPAKTPLPSARPNAVFPKEKRFPNRFNRRQLPPLLEAKRIPHTITRQEE